MNGSSQSRLQFPGRSVMRCLGVAREMLQPSGQYCERLAEEEVYMRRTEERLL